MSASATGSVRLSDAPEPLCLPSSCLSGPASEGSEQTELPELDGNAEHLAGVCSALTQHVLYEVREVVQHTMEEHGLAAPSITLLLVGSHPAAIS